MAGAVLPKDFSRLSASVVVEKNLLGTTRWDVPCVDSEGLQPYLTGVPRHEFPADFRAKYARFLTNRMAAPRARPYLVTPRAS